MAASIKPREIKTLSLDPPLPRRVALNPVWVIVPAKVTLRLSRIPSGHVATQMAINNIILPLPGVMSPLHKTPLTDLQCLSTTAEAAIVVNSTAEIIDNLGADIVLLVLKVVSLKKVMRLTKYLISYLLPRTKPF